MENLMHGVGISTLIVGWAILLRAQSRRILNVSSIRENYHETAAESVLPNLFL